MASATIKSIKKNNLNKLSETLPDFFMVPKNHQIWSPTFCLLSSVQSATDFSNQMQIKMTQVVGLIKKDFQSNGECKNMFLILLRCPQNLQIWSLS